jgi:tetratricopeptide (TPR) repeat protein
MAKKIIKVSQKKTNRSRHPEQLLSWALVVSVSTFFVLATARCMDILVAPVEQAINLTADMSDFDRGQYYFNHGQYADGTYDLKEARKYFTRAIAADPKANHLAWYQLGRIDFLEGRFNDALYKFNMQQVYFGDGVPSVHYMLGLTYGYKARRDNDAYSWRKAEEGFQTYIGFAEYSPWARVDLAWVYFSQGKFEEMLPILEQGIEHHRDNPWLHNMYGLALLNTGQKEAARAHFELASELASYVTPEEWGMSYPGNDPRSWTQGLREFQELIKKNLKLADS